MMRLIWVNQKINMISSHLKYSNRISREIVIFQSIKHNHVLLLMCSHNHKFSITQAISFKRIFKTCMCCKINNRYHNSRFKLQFFHNSIKFSNKSHKWTWCKIWTNNNNFKALITYSKINSNFLQCYKEK